MKQIVKKISKFTLGLALCFGGVVALSSRSEKAVATEAIGNYSTSASTYYNDITATSGKELAAQLHDLITSTHKYYSSYADNGANGYQKQTDQYYENGSKVSGYIYEFYSGVKWPNAWDPNSGSTTGGYNREHCWCQSNSNGMWGETGGGADMHHLRPVENRLNSTRGNHPYGTVSNRDSHKTYAKFGTNATYALGGYYYDDTFEPIDSKKGDVARIIMYTYLHYNSYRVSEIFGSYGTTNGGGSSSYFASSLLSVTKIMKPSTESVALELLLDWNASDPVDEIEMRRNEQVAKYQGNRNPFIDNSNYADMIWGDGTPVVTPTVNYVSISPTSLNLDLNGTTSGELTATVNVSNDAPQTVTWLSSNTSIATVNNGVVTAVAKGTCTITATSTYNTNKSASCEVKVVDTSGGGGGGTSETLNGTISFGNASGRCNINGASITGDDSEGNTWTITTEGTTSFTPSATCAQIGSKKAPATSITFSTTLASEMTITSFSASLGGNTDTAGTVSLKVDDVTVGSDNLNSTSDVTVNATNTVQIGSILTVYITDIVRAVKAYSISYTAQSSSSGNTKTLSSISLNTSNVQTEFYVGDTFDYSGLEVTAYYDDESEETVNGTILNLPDMSTSGNKTVVVSYTENSVTKESGYVITVLDKEVTGISASVKKTYHPGEKILKEDILAENNLGEELDEFEFIYDEYLFTYDDAASGGEDTIKVFEDAIVTDDFTCDLLVSVSRNEYQNNPSYSDVMTKSWTGVSGTSYSEWTNKTLLSGVIYAGQTAGGNGSIQMRTNGNNTGIVATANNDNLILSSIAVSWNPNTDTARKLEVYVSETPYSSAADLYKSETKGELLGTISFGDASAFSITGSHKYIGLKSSGSALYLDDITITYGGGDTAANVANYIMYEDTNNQCTSKFDVAEGYFTELSTEQKSAFMTSDDYVISTARTRFNAWATHLGKVITTDAEGNYVIQNVKYAKLTSSGQLNLEEDSSLIILFIICTLGAGSLSAFYLVKKKKKN